MPSPKSYSYLTIVPSGSIELLPSTVISKGTIPDVGLTEKTAIGGLLTNSCFPGVQLHKNKITNRNRVQNIFLFI